MTEMRIGTRFGILSLVCAIAACCMCVVLSYIASFGVLRGGVVLKVMGRIGLVRSQRSYIAELKPVGIFTLDDVNVMYWLTGVAFLITLLAVVLALFAEYKCESTLYFAAGFIVATVGIGLLQPLVMVIVQILGAVAMFEIRRRYACKT
jgi:hypothetical protein